MTDLASHTLGDPHPPSRSGGSEEEEHEAAADVVVVEEDEAGTAGPAAPAASSSSASTAPPLALDPRLAWLAGRAASLLGLTAGGDAEALAAEPALASFLDGPSPVRPLVVWAGGAAGATTGTGRSSSSIPPTAARVALFTRRGGVGAPVDVECARAAIMAAVLPAAALKSLDVVAALARGVLAPAAAGAAVRARAAVEAATSSPAAASASMTATTHRKSTSTESAVSSAAPFLTIPPLTSAGATLLAAAAAAAADAAADLASAASAAAARTRGRTLLPLPAAHVVVRAAATDFRDDAAISKLEGVVDVWTRLARGMLAAQDGEAGEAAALASSPSGGALAAEAARLASLASDAAGMVDQLASDAVKGVEAALTASNSSYAASIARLRSDADSGAARVQAAARLAAALLAPCTPLTTAADPDAMEYAAAPLWACLAVAWNSLAQGGQATHLTPAAFEHLLRLVAADALARVRTLVPGAGGDGEGSGGGGGGGGDNGDAASSNNSTADPADVVARAKAVLRGLGGFKAGFFRARAAALSKKRTVSQEGGSGSAAEADPSSPPSWPFNPASIFREVDAAAARAAVVADAFTALAAYAKAGRAEIGGPAGAGLTAAARAAASDGAAAAGGLVSAAYNLLDDRAGADAFAAAVASLASATPGIDARLAAVVGATIDVRAGVGAALRAGEAVADGLLDRRPAAAVLAGRAGPLLAALAAECEAVQAELAGHASAPPLPRGATPVAGALAWARGLKDRVAALAVRTTGLLGGDALARGEGGQAAGEAVAGVLAALEAYEGRLLALWRDQAAATCAAGLGSPVLVRLEGSTSKPTLWPACASAIPADVDALLAEARALMALPGAAITIPADVKALVSAGPAMRADAAALDAAATRAAALAASITPLEAPLLAPRLAAVRAALDAGSGGNVTWAHAVNANNSKATPATTAATLTAAVDAAADAAAAVRGGADVVARLRAMWTGVGLAEEGPTGRPSPLPYTDWCDAVEAGLTSRRAAVKSAAKEAAAKVAAARAVFGPEAAGGAVAWTTFEAGLRDDLVGAAGDVAAGAANWLAGALSGKGGSGTATATVSLTVTLDLDPVGGSAPTFVPALTGSSAAVLRGRRGGRDMPSLASSIDAWMAALAADVAGVGPAFGGGGTNENDASPDAERVPPPAALAAAAVAARSALANAAREASIWGKPYDRVASHTSIRDVATALAAFVAQHSYESGGRSTHPPLAAYEAAFADARAIADAIDALPPSTSSWHPAAAAVGGGVGRVSMEISEAWAPSPSTTTTSSSSSSSSLPPLHIDARPARQALAAAAGRWEHALSAHLAAQVATALAEEDAYAVATTATLENGEAEVVVVEEAVAISPAATEGTAVEEPPQTDTAGAEAAAAAPKGEATGAVPTIPQPQADPAALAVAAAASARASAALYAATRAAREVATRSGGGEGAGSADARHAALTDAAALLAKVGAPLPEPAERSLAAAPGAWRALAKRAAARTESLAPARAAEADRLRAEGKVLGAGITAFVTRFNAAGLADGPPGGGGLTAAHAAWAAATLADLVGDDDDAGGAAADAHSTLASLEKAASDLATRQALMDVFPLDASPLASTRATATALTALWAAATITLATLDAWASTNWSALEAGALGEQACALARSLPASLPKAACACAGWRAVDARVAAVVAILPLAEELAHPAMRARHWDSLGAAVGAAPGSLRPPGVVVDGGSGGESSGTPQPHSSSSPPLTLGTLLALDLPAHAEAVSTVVDAARREAGVEKALARIDATWGGGGGMNLAFQPHLPTGIPALTIHPAITDALESDGLALQNLATGRLAQANPGFAARVSAWQARLAAADALVSAWAIAQRKWQALVAIFTGSADLRSTLPDACARFDAGDDRYRKLMADAAADSPRVIDAAAVPGALAALEAITAQLEGAEAALAGYLEAKCRAFPRFYFLAPTDLLDLLARGGDPHAVSAHLPKAFEAVAGLVWAPPGADGRPSNVATALVSADGETVPLATPTVCMGPAEVWLGALEGAMRAALASEFKAALASYEDAPSRPAWALAHTAQVSVIASRTHFAASVGAAFRALEDGDEGALRAEAARQTSQLATLISAIDDPALSPAARRKLVTLCTIDVHARDVVAGLAIDAGAATMGPDCFKWASQLRYYAHPTTREATAAICDAEIPYGYEFVGNPGCLCITPLTDRCYITLTQAQRLVLGGAPAGPAGTGKTETTKDLARALGVSCYVFNCSSSMDYRAMGSIFKGLAQTGAWGCFDEFNRIAVDVLSVCSTQYKAVLDGLRARASTFDAGDGGPALPLKSSVMAFITMNPGYPGRAELPESLKVKKTKKQWRGRLRARARARGPTLTLPLFSPLFPLL